MNRSLAARLLLALPAVLALAGLAGCAALQATPPKVTVASTVGAGDSLLAGMLHGLLTGDTPEQTLRRATAIAAMAVTQIGFGISDHAQEADRKSVV